METITLSPEKETAAQIAGEIIVATVTEQGEVTAAEQLEKAQIIAHRTRPNLRRVLNSIEDNADERGLTPDEVRAAKRDAILLSRRR